MFVQLDISKKFYNLNIILSVINGLPSYYQKSFGAK